jgi:hypothetical protein
MLELMWWVKLKRSFQGNLELELGVGSRLKHNFQGTNVGGQKHAKVYQKKVVFKCKKTRICDK